MGFWTHGCTSTLAVSYSPPLTSSGPSCSRSADALSEAVSGSRPAALHGNGWSAQPWLAALCLRTKGCIMTKGGEPSPCPQCGAAGSPYLPGRRKAGISHQLQTPVLVNHRQPAALGPPGRAGTECEHGQGQMGWQAEGGSCMALWGSLAGCDLLGPGHHDIGRG